MNISKKQSKILSFPYTGKDILICDGAIRSGKTMFTIISFIEWAMDSFNRQNFGICGKTVGSAEDNIIIPYMNIKLVKDKYDLKYSRISKELIIKKGNIINRFKIYGGKDASSYQLIQGITLAGVLLDEIVLMHESFVNQAIARCSVNGSKIFCSCNPASPQHFFYKDFIQKTKEKNALYLHFTMKDNPSLSEKILKRYENMYSGVFYDRYIRGKWVVAEGLIYTCFSEQNHVVKTEKRIYEKMYISIDYGLQNAMVYLLFGLCKGVWYLVKEFYHSGRDTNTQYNNNIYYKKLDEFLNGYNIERIIIDPSALSFIREIISHKKYKVRSAINDVIEGINEVSKALISGKIYINDVCINTIKEFLLYRWDDKSIEDKPIKENDHAMDAFRYFINTAKINRR